MYPDANVLCVEPKSFPLNKRQEVLRRICDEDFDGIIMAYSCFSLIPLSKDYVVCELRERIEALKEQYAKTGWTITRLRREIDKLEKQVEEILAGVTEPAADIFFDELGITRIFVDEAHNFKNVPLRTKISNVLGISGGGSMKCQDMMDKIRMVQKQNDGKGAVLATGTPNASPYQH
jgi:N12 class adenine-specific DNA methylase